MILKMSRSDGRLMNDWTDWPELSSTACVYESLGSKLSAKVGVSVGVGVLVLVAVGVLVGVWVGVAVPVGVAVDVFTGVMLAVTARSLCVSGCRREGLGRGRRDCGRAGSRCGRWQ